MSPDAHAARAIGAIASGSSTPSCIRRSSALSRSADAGRAVRDQLPGDVGAVDEAGRDRVDRVAPAVRREVGARHLEDARVVRPASRYGDRRRVQ